MTRPKKVTNPKTKAAPKKRAVKAVSEPVEPAKMKYYSIFELPNGYIVYKVATTKKEIENGEQLGKLHKSIANIEAVKERWLKDAESKGLKKA